MDNIAKKGKNGTEISEKDLSTGKVMINNIEITSIEDWNKVIKLLNELQQENQQLKKQLEEYQIQNFNLREDKIIKKMSFPIEEIRDKSLLELYSMPSYEDLKKENEELIRQLQQKEDIINKARKYISKHTQHDENGYVVECLYVEEAKELLEILDNKGE